MSTEPLFSNLPPEVADQLKDLGPRERAEHLRGMVLNFIAFETNPPWTNILTAVAQVAGDMALASYKDFPPDHAEARRRQDDADNAAVAAVEKLYYQVRRLTEDKYSKPKGFIEAVFALMIDWWKEASEPMSLRAFRFLNHEAQNCPAFKELVVGANSKDSPIPLDRLFAAIDCGSLYSEPAAVLLATLARDEKARSWVLTALRFMKPLRGISETHGTDFAGCCEKIGEAVAMLGTSQRAVQVLLDQVNRGDVPGMVRATAIRPDGDPQRIEIRVGVSRGHASQDFNARANRAVDNLRRYMRQFLDSCPGIGGELVVNKIEADGRKVGEWGRFPLAEAS